MDTYFAPALRPDRQKLNNQIASISDNPIMDALLSAAAGLMIVLNQDRMIEKQARMIMGLHRGA